MQNHKKIEVVYNRASLLDILDPKPRDYSIPCDIRPLTSAETYSVASILNLKLPIKSILYFKLGSNFIGYIHKDVNINEPLFKQEYALNLPITDCEEVYMKWYKPIDHSIKSESFLGPSKKGHVPLLDHSNATCIDEVNCNQCNLVRVEDWHAVYNYSTNRFGYLISIRFHDSIKPDLPINEWWR